MDDRELVGLDFDRELLLVEDDAWLSMYDSEDEEDKVLDESVYVDFFELVDSEAVR